MTGLTPPPAHHAKYFTRWYTQFCPRHEECSDPAWRKANQCRSYESEEDCRLKILEHFTRSGKHNANPEEDLWESAQHAEVRTARDPGTWFPEPPCTTVVPDADVGLNSIGTLPPAKRQRVQDEAQKSADGSSNSLVQRKTVGVADETEFVAGAGPAEETPETKLTQYDQLLAKATAAAAQHALKHLTKAICAGRGCCYSTAIAGGLAGVRNK